jgi:hypothetical protein
MQNTQTDTAAVESVPASPFHLKLQSQPSLDLDALRLPQNFGAVAGVKKVITTIPVRKPNNQSYVRVRSGDAWRMSAAILQLKEDGECYLVIPALYSELAQEVRPKLLYTAVTRDGNPFLWPVNLPGEDGRLDAWSQSAHTAATMAEASWIRLVANRTVGAYDVMEATGLASETASWPELTFPEMVNLAFRDRLIDSLDHPLVKRLRGEL